MKKVKYLILGAGPAGLTFASMLKRRGEDSFRIPEGRRPWARAARCSVPAVHVHEP